MCACVPHTLARPECPLVLLTPSVTLGGRWRWGGGAGFHCRMVHSLPPTVVSLLVGRLCWRGGGVGGLRAACGWVGCEKPPPLRGLLWLQLAAAATADAPGVGPWSRERAALGLFILIVLL